MSAYRRGLLLTYAELSGTACAREEVARRPGASEEAKARAVEARAEAERWLAALLEVGE